MKRLLKTSSSTGSASVPTAARAGRRRTRVEQQMPELARRPPASPARPRWWRRPRRSRRARSTVSAGRRSSRRGAGVLAQASVREHPYGGVRFVPSERSARAAAARASARSCGPVDADRLDGDRLDDQGLVHDEAERARGAHARTAPVMAATSARDRQAGVRSGVPQHARARAMRDGAVRDGVGAAVPRGSRSASASHSSAHAGSSVPSSSRPRRPVRAWRWRRRARCRTRRARRRAAARSRVPMPRASATGQACWPPAPPKQASA